MHSTYLDGVDDGVLEFIQFRCFQQKYLEPLFQIIHTYKYLAVPTHSNVIAALLGCMDVTIKII